MSPPDPAYLPPYPVSPARNHRPDPAAAVPRQLGPQPPPRTRDARPAASYGLVTTRIPRECLSAEARGSRGGIVAPSAAREGVALDSVVALTVRIDAFYAQTRRFMARL